MLFLGLGLILLGVLAILAAIFVSEPGRAGELLGFDVTTLSAFMVGVAAGAAVLLGLSILRWGTRRELAHRRERKELARLQEKLEQVEENDRPSDETGTARTTGAPAAETTGTPATEPAPGRGPEDRPTA